ncbi:FeoB small GTPase domain-containing protein [Anaerolineales bacterium HSG25]|nr:FeoB small GTPase domain-containing protein [Anaerolineales bacterium HSG25]
MPPLTIALAGNPNTGKSTIFNALTGSRQRVGNWPGKTIERKAGMFKHDGFELEIVDLPGTYSLSAYSLEEEIARDFIIKATPAGVVNVLDATNLERNLYLTTQILETGVPTMLVLNMYDQATARQYRIDTAALSTALHGILIVQTSASRGEGLETLKQTIVTFAQQQANRRKPHGRYPNQPHQPSCHV